MYQARDPPAISCYSKTFLSVTRRLLFSHAELAKEVGHGASPLRRFISLSGHASSQLNLTKWSGERLRSLLDRACRVEGSRNDWTKDFLYNRADPPYYRSEEMERWIYYQENREHRYYWAQVLSCNYDWDWDLSESLKRIFSRPKQPLIRLGEMQDNDNIKRAFENDVPEVVTFEYRTAAGEIRHRTFRADPLLEDVTAGSDASNGSVPQSTPVVPECGSPSSEDRLEYENVLEYLEINRHARRKIEAWLYDG